MSDLIARDGADLARRAAERVVSMLAARQGRLAVSLSGGSTPRALYQALAAPPLRERLPWARIHWFWGDERFVPPDDAKSNLRMVREAMLDRVPAPADHIHPVPTLGCTAEEAAARYEAELRAFHGDDLRQPLFDLVLMGLGTNGHTASLFPGQPALAERERWAVSVAPPGEPVRITLTWPPLESTRYAAFLVAGPEKAEVVRRVRQGDPTLVASHYHPAGPLEWWLDQAAAGGGQSVS